MSNIDINDYKDEKTYQDGFTDIGNLETTASSREELEDPMNSGYMDADLIKFMKYVQERLRKTASYSNELFQERSIDDVKNKISMKLNSDSIEEMDKRVLEDFLSDIDYLFEAEVYKAKQ